MVCHFINPLGIRRLLHFRVHNLQKKTQRECFWIIHCDCYKVFFTNRGHKMLFCWIFKKGKNVWNLMGLRLSSLIGTLQDIYNVFLSRQKILLCKWYQTHFNKKKCIYFQVLTCFLWLVCPRDLAVSCLAVLGCCPSHVLLSVGPTRLQITNQGMKRRDFWRLRSFTCDVPWTDCPCLPRWWWFSL